MKHLILSLFIISGFINFAFANLTVEGNYQGKNLYVQNPYNDATETYCVTEVFVNDQSLSANINSGAFEIKLNELGLEIGAPVKVQIIHSEGCKPKILNNDLTHVNRTIRIEPASLKNGQFRWKDNPELRSYRIEQYRWNKWIEVDVVISNPDDEGYYSATLNDDLHSGTNTFRIAADNGNGVRAFSNNLIAQGSAEAVTYEMLKSERLLQFSSETQYELYNELGERVLTGKSIQIDLAGLSSGDYYLNFDNYNSKIKVN